MNRREFVGGTAAVALTAGLLTQRAGAERQTKAAAERPKKSVMFSMLPGALPLEARFQLAKDVGFEGVEIGPVGEEEAKALRSAAENAGLPIHSIIYGGWDAPLSDPDPATIQRGLTNTRQALQCAKWVGADNILLVPAVVTPKVRYKDAYERSQKHIRELIPTAEKLGVMICIEEVWNKFLQSPLEFAHYIDEFHHPLVQAYFDVGNVVINGYPEDWIRTLGKRIKKVHIKDFKRAGSQWVNLWDGDVNWPEVRRAFAEVGFHSFMNTELSGGDEAYLRDLSQRVDRIINAV